MNYDKNKHEYNNTYNRENYRRLSIFVRPGQQVLIKAEAEKKGMSINGYVQNALKSQMESEGVEYPEA